MDGRMYVKKNALIECVTFTGFYLPSNHTKNKLLGRLIVKLNNISYYEICIVKIYCQIYLHV